jgi:signal transduction histidine kinase
MISFDSPRLQVAPGSGSLSVFADRQLVCVVLKNLLENALKYSPKDSVVSIQLGRKPWVDGEAVYVRVSNAPGEAGWPDAQRLFSKYYRSAGSHHTTGSGLGLHLSKQMALYLGGDVLHLPDADLVRFEFCLPV